MPHGTMPSLSLLHHFLELNKVEAGSYNAFCGSNFQMKKYLFFNCGRFHFCELCYLDQGKSYGDSINIYQLTGE
jgi:hypothetical protein